jgi:hypothetical protein
MDPCFRQQSIEEIIFPPRKSTQLSKKLSSYNENPNYIAREVLLMDHSLQFEYLQSLEVDLHFRVDAVLVEMGYHWTGTHYEKEEPLPPLIPTD